MNFVLILAGLLFPVPQVCPSSLGFPLFTQAQGQQARLSLNTTCPAPTYYPFDVLWASETKDGGLCPLKSEKVYVESLSNSPVNDLRDCITSAGSSTVYCVYAFPSFAQGRGLSVVASPTIIPSINDAASALDSVSGMAKRGLYYEKTLPGRGKGLISNHTFQKGDLILTSTPLLMVQERAMHDISKKDRLRLQGLSISKLARQSRELFHGLAGHFGGDKIEDVLLTNGFSGTFGASKEGFGIVVPESARLNHDCRPNARFAFDPRTLMHKVHAARIIEPGEELTFSYIDEKQAYSARQQQLKSHWGFECGCKLCSASEFDRNRSDSNLRRIAALRKSLRVFTAENYQTTNPDMALELVSLYEKEGLNGALAEAYMITALWSCIWGDLEETKRWATSAVENWLVWEAAGETNLKGTRILTHRPQDHWCWEAKRKQSSG